MAVEVGKFHHGDGTYDFAIAENEATGDEKGGKHVLAFSESDGPAHHHHVPDGTGDGEFSK